MTAIPVRTIGAMATLAVATTVAAGASTEAAIAGQRVQAPKASHFGHGSNRITNRWFPLARGSEYVYDGQKDGKQARDVMTVTRRIRTITGIRAAVIADRLFLNGVLAERTTDWYAQDKRGTVWYLGEATAELDANGMVTSTEGSFLNGRDGAKGGIFMPAHPRVGYSGQQESFKGQAEDRFRIVDMATSVTTPAVSSQNAMLTEEKTPLEPGVVDHKYYVQGIGTVKEQQVAGAPPGQGEETQLVSFKAGQ
ncbi:MAG: hypothetical protein QOD14_2342 [Solirubrobacterales bacterium]|jgi:hypothetical protein|nr:hypothetical protein [Solirubrobacterales bacterium]